ncbi:axial regulator YABBY 4 [Cynara cardunculus var. scolymus]|uniref:High mobility group (HMG) box domain-containing protein n=1 Tax=Cynara cardunculus var. scolymus TaxID=59895 RepID=A0A103XRI1_CYNCS|nr:axial regulator YABBY 4 [Cynara cardunculus var. scolymus]KVH95555.1 High mobility group (HMG) box domain-containing protein [Cynara cardunculus var. scolymus]
MSALNHLLDEQICYVQCGFCTTVLLVSVPCSCLSMVVTVKCGHCTSLLSVNMMRSSFLPLHLFSSLDNQEEPTVEVCREDVQVPKPALLSKHSSSPLISSSSSDEDNDDDLVLVNHVVNKPPEKRQRAPSAYNKFIKEEIRRLKTQHPNMSHKQAFSTAAKNWAHSPPSQQNEGGKSKGSGNESTVMMIQEPGSDDQPS